MAGANFMDEIDCGNFFDHIDDFLDFPTDDLGSELVASHADSDSFPTIFTGCSSDALFASDSVFSANTISDLSAQLSVPYEDIVQLEWLSNFVEDSFSGGGMTMEKNTLWSTKDSSRNQFQTSSPVSVLESCSSSSRGGKTIPVSRDKKKARSKRPRPATFNPRSAIQLISPTSSLTDTPNQAILDPCASSESGTTSAESRPLSDQPKMKKKKIKIVFPSNPQESPNNKKPNPNPEVRKCMHCEITKTPQWRAGPMGPKTLCNACGVRYKSGRLFPEYRPAASPTFIPSIHSNSHKKVAEMRSNSCLDKTPMSGIIPNSIVGIAAEPSQELEVIPTTDLLPTCI